MLLISSFSSIFSSELLFGIFPVILLGIFFEELEELEEGASDEIWGLLVQRIGAVVGRIDAPDSDTASGWVPVVILSSVSFR